MSIFHQHKWEVVDAQSGTYVDGGLGTTILYRCRCHALRSRTINGVWTHNQLIAAEGARS